MYPSSVDGEPEVHSVAGSAPSSGATSGAHNLPSLFLSLSLFIWLLHSFFIIIIINILPARPELVTWKGQKEGKKIAVERSKRCWCHDEREERTRVSGVGSSIWLMWPKVVFFPDSRHPSGVHRHITYATASSCTHARPCWPRKIPPSSERNLREQREHGLLINESSCNMYMCMYAGEVVCSPVI